jgi:hypothetical protein
MLSLQYGWFDGFETNPLVPGWFNHHFFIVQTFYLNSGRIQRWQPVGETGKARAMKVMDSELTWLIFSYGCEIN